MIRSLLAAGLTVGLTAAGLHVAAKPAPAGTCVPVVSLAARHAQVALAGEQARINEHTAPLTNAQAVSVALRSAQADRDSRLVVAAITAGC